MPFYFLAQIRMENEEVYQAYIEKAGEIFARYSGTYLAVDNQAELLEGEWDYTRAVLISFPTKADFEAWYRSPEYQEILRHRLEGAHCDSILIRGLEKN